MRVSFFRNKKAKGLTLIELLIVVAIIGVLSTIGIPTYRKIVARAKKSEAKVSLGGVYTVETAFYTEYNAYGNNLKQMGFDIPSGARSIYSIGFPTATGCGSPATVQPDDANVKNSITAAFPLYYDTTTAGAYKAVFGRAITGTSVCKSGDTSDAKGTGFTATATGAIISGVTDTSDATDDCHKTAGKACQDTWSMNQERSLTNASFGEGL